MVLRIESTTKVVTLDHNVPARIWEGMTDSGIPVICFVTRVAVKEGHDDTEFKKELQVQRAPSPEALAIPGRLIL
jgi:hypothetical protein